MKSFNELDLVRWIEKLAAGRRPGLVLGVGDDCAAFRPDKGKIILATTDTLAEGVHFDGTTALPRLLGGKAASVNLSDIASMGGEPKYALMSPLFPKGLSRKWTEEFFIGFHETLTRYGCALIGGNISSAVDRVSVTVTILGQIAENRMVKRDGAKSGDLIYITGTPGDSALGLDLLLSGRKRLTKDERYLVSRHLSPTPRVEWGRLIAEKRLASSMIDVSDGVALDLLRVTQASKVSATVSLDSIPLSVPAAKVVREKGEQAWSRILNGGEDYELLFTVPPRNVKKMDRLIASGKIVAAKIGKVVSGAPKALFQNSLGKTLKLKKLGWVHSI